MRLRQRCEKDARLGTIMLLILVLTVTMIGQDLDPCAKPPSPIQHDPNPCATANNQENCLVAKLKIDSLVREYNKYFTNDYRAVVGNIVPGSGFSAGAGFRCLWGDGNDWDVTKNNTFDARAKVSTKGYWEFDSNLHINFETNHKGAKPDKNLNLYGIVRDLRRLDFYGVGPESRKQDQAVFHYREAVLGLDFTLPLENWFDVGGAIEGVLPHITPITDLSIRSVERSFTEASAPGISSQAPTLHLIAFAGFHGKGKPESWRLDYRFYYHFYRDLRGGRYSFRRFDADLKQSLSLGDIELRLRGRLSLADVGSGKVQPFYLMRTLGGSDITGTETLRGFSDYRFRDNDLVLAQAELAMPLYGPIDLFAFNDVGKVAPSLKHFNVGRFRDTFGAGFSIVPSKLRSYLFRLYFAFGSGEGSQFFWGAGDPTTIGGRLVR